MFRIFLINFLLAISTTIGMTIIPFLITDTLGLSLFILGLLEGTSEFLSNVFRLTNGVLFDKIKNKRIVFVSSTGMAFISKALLLLPTPWAILFAKIVERIANGTFAAPRDAFVAGEAKNKGMALGLLHVSKTFGCILGPLIVSISAIFLGNFKDNLSFFVLLCCLLAFPAFIVSFSLNVKEITVTPFSFQEFKTVFRKISPILFLSFLFFMGRFNDGLLMMHLKQKDFPEWFYLSTIAIFNLIMFISSPIIGKQIDKNNLKLILYITISALLIFNICFYQLTVLEWSFAIAGLVTWGIQRAGAQIVFAAFVFKSVNKANYGTAIGLFYILSGFATMISSFLCGYMANYNFSFVFAFSGFFALLALGLAGSILSKKLFPLHTTHAIGNI